MKNIKEKVLKETNFDDNPKSPHMEVNAGIMKSSISKELNLYEKKVGKVIDEEKKLVKMFCLGLVHPSQGNQKEFTKWLQSTVNFHLTLLKQKLGIK